MRRVLILLLVAAACWADTAVAPPDAFIAAGYTPQVLASGSNVDFSVGFEAGESLAVVSPDNCAFPDWWTYLAAVKQTELPRTRLIFWPINYNVGVDSARLVAAHFFFYNDPTAGGVIDCSASSPARIKRVKPPMIHRHLDLIEKGAKGVTRTVYRGARVIL